MSQPTVIVLHAPLTDAGKLEPFVDDCLDQGIRLIAVFGQGAAAVEDLIDDIIVGDGSREYRFMATSSRSAEPLNDVLEFAASWDGGSAVREVRL